MKLFSRKFMILLFIALASNGLFGQDVPGPSKNLSGKWGYKNKSGTVVIDYLYDDARTFSNDLAAVKKSGLWGYIDISGSVIVEPLYEDAWYFTNGLAAVKSYDKWGYINKKGEVVIPIQYEDAAEFVGSLAWVKKDGLIGYIDTNGETVISFEYKAAVSFSDGYALAYKQTGWGVINTKGVPMAGENTFIFDDARPFSKEMAPVYSKVKALWGLAGTDGKLKVDFAFITPDIDRTTTAFGWAYAATSYANKDKVALQKAVTLVEGSTLSNADREKLIPYWDMLGEREKISATRKAIREANKTYRSSSASADLSLAVAPIKLAMYSAGKYSLRQVPLYGQIRLGTLAIGARYNTYNQYHDRYRYGAMFSSEPDSTLIYDGHEYSAVFTFLKKNNISKGMAGYGHSGEYMGFELRYSDLKCNSIVSDVLDENYTTLFYQVPIAPAIKRYDASFVVGYANSRKVFFWDIGMSFGAGYKVHDFGADYQKSGYTYSDDRLNEGWTPAYLVMRFYFRLGINLF